MARRAGKRVATRKAYLKAQKATKRSATRKKTARKKSARKKTGTTRKTARKTASKTTRKTTRKPASRTRSLKPRAITSGRGPSPADIGAVVVEAFNEHRPDVELWDRFWSDDVESVEGLGVSQAWRGRDAMQAKGEAWIAEHTVHSATAEGPYVGATGFSIRFRMDVEEKSTGNRILMEEIGVYTVRNGKVIREEFMYGAVTPVATGGEGEEIETTARFEEVVPT